MNAVPIRSEWVGTTIEGIFPLLEWLGGSGNSGVFLTELPGSTITPENTVSRGSRKAAIKLLPASPNAEERLAIWTSAASLSHPHLVRILHFGRTEIDGVRLLYIVTELATEVLSQILPDRPLTPEETRQMIGPVLDALTYVHAQGFVHGHVKPSNILVVDDQVKLSADGLLPSGRPALEWVENDAHHAPEVATGAVAPCLDLWSLGVTLVETLTTQQPPLWDAASNAEPQIPANVPKPFDEIVRGCLRVDPTHRATISDVQALLEGRPRATAPSAMHLPHHPHRLVERTAPPKIPLVPLIVGFFLLVAIIFGPRMRGCGTRNAPTQTDRVAETPPVEPGARAHGARSQARGASQGAVVNRVEPDVPRSASDTIRGTVTVTLRVSVNRSGAVTNAELASSGPSAYFARIAAESARNWTFRPPQRDGGPVASTWLLRYEFRRDGTGVSAEETGP